MANCITFISFLDPDEEAKSLAGLAAMIYKKICDSHRATGSPPPSASTVFPLVFLKARELGETSQELNDVVHACYKGHPAMTRYWLEHTDVPEPPNQATENRSHQQEALPATENVELIGAPIFNSIQPLSYRPIENGVRPNGQEQIEQGKRYKDPAYVITQKLINTVQIKIMAEVIYSYNGQYYAKMTEENLRRLILGICREAVAAEGNARLINEIFKLLLCEPKICDHPENLSSNYVSFVNGVLDTNTGQLFPHSPRFNTYYMLTANYKNSTIHPVFDRFLNTISGGDVVLRQRILEVMGVCLFPDNALKVFFVFQGVPDSGKSVLASFIRRCLNPEAVVAMEIQDLGEHFMPSNLIGRQLCTAMDISASPLNAKSISVFKMATGGDPITADVKYKSAITFINRARFILGTNHPLLTQYEDPAFYRRAVVIPFKYTVPSEVQNRNLPEELDRERDAIVRDAYNAYIALRKRNYIFSGTYQLNEIFKCGYLSQPVSPDVESILATFIQQNFIADSIGIVFVCEIHDWFCRETGLSIPLNAFTQKFLQACHNLGMSEVHSIQKARIVPNGNPQARIGGIRLASDTAN